jgi:O-acetyl-ADP-ribose deacetylase (regulator of RNase III)
MATLSYLKGDATNPGGDPGKTRIIPHVCNSLGKWGAGFVLQVSKAFPEAETAYRSMGSYEMGSVQFVPCAKGVVVANMIAQWGIGPLRDGSKQGCPPLRYGALFDAMFKVAYWAEHNGKCEIHCPRFGAGLAGGDWRVIEALIQHLWVSPGLDVHVYWPERAVP